MSMRTSFMKMVDGYLVSRLAHLQSEVIELTTDKRPYAKATEQGRIFEVELLQSEIKKFYAEGFEHIAPNTSVLTFEGLVHSLSDLPDDAPVKLVVFAGLGTKTPMSNLQLTMYDIRRFAAVQKLYIQDRGNGVIKA